MLFLTAECWYSRMNYCGTEVSTPERHGFVCSSLEREKAAGYNPASRKGGELIT